MELTLEKGGVWWGFFVWGVLGFGIPGFFFSFLFFGNRKAGSRYSQSHMHTAAVGWGPDRSRKI